ncbi:MAG: TonB-dependent receptor [Akkermansia sp.]|nr:TonB-dependent receptor [Akkermansia sp.]
MISNNMPLNTGAATVVLAIAMAGGCAYAQAETPEIELAPMTVSAHDGLNLPRNETGVSVEVLDVPQLRQEGNLTLAQALTTVPGVNIQSGGGANQQGNVANVSIRGMSSDTATLAIMDGMRLYNTGGGGLLTSNVMGRTELFSIGNAEVLKGSQGATYGGGAMGGVIFMETPRGKDEPRMSFFNEVGSHNSYTTNTTAQGQEGELSYFLTATYTRTDNDIRFVGGYTPTHRNAGEYESWQEALRLDWQPNDDNLLTLTYRREDSEYGYAGMYNDWFTGGRTESYSNYRFRTNLVTARWQTEVTEKLTSSLMAGYYGYDASLGRGYCQNLRNVQIEWNNAYTWCPHQTTAAGFAWNRSDFSVKSAGERQQTDANLEHTYAFFAEHIYAPAENWQSSLAARMELSNLYDTHTTVRAASSYRFNNDQSRLFASAATGYRAPSSFQRSNGATESWGTTYHGNPNLKTEKSLSADVGVEHDIADGHTLSVTAFWQRRENAITTVPLDAMNSTYTNDSGHWTIIGAEVALRGTIEQAWNTGYKLAWTYTQPKTSDERQIPWTARQTCSAELHTTPFEGFTTGVGLTAAIGRSNYEGYAPSEVDNYYSLRWFARYQVNERVTLHLRVENLTDQRFVTESNFTPEYAMLSPGVGIYGGCTIEF